MYLQITKILNNNVAVTRSDKGLETIIMGKGIAFQRKVGDLISEESIEKFFTLTERETSIKFQKLITEIPLEHILVTEKIIHYAKTTGGKKLGDSIYLTLADHLSAAIQRNSEGIILKNALQWDIRQFYPAEFMLGNKAVEIIKEDLGVEFLEDEAAFMALHFVTAQLHEDMSLIHSMTKLIQEITNIAKYNLKIAYDTETPAYYRFINHLKFFAQRLFRHKHYSEEDTGILDSLKDKYQKEYRCVQAIAQFIRQQYCYQMTNEEMLYMTVHIVRVVKETTASV